MHLYLSSYRFGREPQRLSTLLPAGNAAVVIANALDYTDDIPRKQVSVAQEIATLATLGFTANELDLRSFFGRPQVLCERLIGSGLIWVVGGNAFLLRRAFKQSGLDQYLLSRKGDDSLVYGGYSAGAIVVTPTLAGIACIDPPDVLAQGYEPEIIWDGLGLVPYSIAPHYQSAHPDAPLIDTTVQYFIHNKILFKALRDGDVIVTKA